MNARREDETARETDSPAARHDGSSFSGDTSLSHSQPLVIGHRGASALAPENTLAAFKLALDGGADGLEFDVRLARDGVPVVIHDATLRRTCLRDGYVSALSSSELRRADAGAWFNRRFPRLARDEYARERVPTLAEVFGETGARSRALYVELKFERGEAWEPLASGVVKLVRGFGLESRVVVESFAHEAVAGVKRVAPELRTAALFEAGAARPFITARELVARARACGADEVALHYLLARRRTVEAARRAGFGAVVWTVDRPAWAERARSLGLRGLITNHPAKMRAALSTSPAERQERAAKP